MSAMAGQRFEAEVQAEGNQLSMEVPDAVRFELYLERLDQARRRRIEGKATDVGPGPKDG
jgi:hypothetical protein